MKINKHIFGIATLSITLTLSIGLVVNINTSHEEVVAELRQMKIDVVAAEEFLNYFKEMSGPIKKFNELYWNKLLDKMIVAERKKLTAVLIGGYSVKI